MTVCTSSTCEDEAITAIRSIANRNKEYGLQTVIYQILSDDVPKTAQPYCGPCAVKLAAQLTALTDSDLRVTMEVTSAAPVGATT